MGHTPTPPKSIPKTISLPKESGGEIPTIGSQHSLNTLEKNQETLGYSFDTKKFGNSICLKRVSKDSHFVQKDFPVIYVFFLPKYSLSSHGGNSRFS